MSLFKKRDQLRSSHILAVLFLLFIFYVGLAAVPGFLQSTLNASINEVKPEEYIDTVNSQYNTMLDTKRDTAYFRNKGSYIDLCGIIANALGQHTVNGRTMLSNGHLSMTAYQHEPEEIRNNAQNIIRFFREQTSAGKDFLFVLAPSQVYSEDKYLPEGFQPSQQSDADLLISVLNENGVPILDLRENMAKQNISYTDAFYITDHHWKTEYGFWAFGQIVDRLKNMGYASAYEVDITAAENYEFIKYENAFLGSSGKRTGKYFAGTDDYVLIVPKFDTEITVTIASKNVDKTGRFEDVSATNSRIGMDIRLTDPDYFNDDPYGRIGYGNTPITNWRNPTAPEHRKFLLIGDSIANIPFCYLSLYNETCDELDMRQYADDFSAYYETYCPDLVIICVNEYGLKGSEALNVSYDFIPER